MFSSRDGQRRRRIRGRSLSSRVNVEVLSDEDWDLVSEHELARLNLELSGYATQLKDREGVFGVDEAVELLERAAEAVASARLKIRSASERLGDEA